MEIDVVLPCLNEAGALPWVLSRMPLGYRPIVADNGSTDDPPPPSPRASVHGSYPSRNAASAQRATLACWRRAVTSFASWTPMPPSTRETCPPWARPVLAGEADLVLGRRSVQGRGAWPLHARIGNRVLAAELRRRIGVPVRDLGPMRAARREALLALPMSDRRFGYPLEMVVRAAEALAWRITETDVPYYPRTGKSKVTGTLGGTVRTVRDMRRVLASVASPAS